MFCTHYLLVVQGFPRGLFLCFSLLWFLFYCTPDFNIKMIFSPKNSFILLVSHWGVKNSFEKTQATHLPPLHRSRQTQSISKLLAIQRQVQNPQPPAPSPLPLFCLSFVETGVASIFCFWLITDMLQEVMQVLIQRFQKTILKNIATNVLSAVHYLRCGGAVCHSFI